MRFARAAAIFFAAVACAAAWAQAEGRPATQKVMLGKLGQALKAATIHSSASSKSRAYYKVKPYEYLVLKPSSSSTWTRVLMQNGIYGYVKTSLVASLPFDVTMDMPAGARGNTALASRSRADAANYGLQFRGTPYKWGGNDPLSGIDCSGFVKFLYGQIGLNLPRTAAEQAKYGQAITKFEDLQPGDRLYFWDSKRNKIGHTGVYLGNGIFVHSSAGKGGVSTDFLGESKWRSILVAARR
jgi:cell wall-associated NlpC family hydrolase